MFTINFKDVNKATWISAKKRSFCVDRYAGIVDRSETALPVITEYLIYISISISGVGWSLHICPSINNFSIDRTISIFLLYIALYEGTRETIAIFDWNEIVRSKI